MTITSITAGTTMAATAIAGHIKHGHDKHGRGTPKAGLYLYLPVYTSIRPLLLLLRQTGDEVAARSSSRHEAGKLLET